MNRSDIEDSIKDNIHLVRMATPLGPADDDGIRTIHLTDAWGNYYAGRIKIGSDYKERYVIDALTYYDKMVIAEYLANMSGDSISIQLAYGGLVRDRYIVRIGPIYEEEKRLVSMLDKLTGRLFGIICVPGKKNIGPPLPLVPDPTLSQARECEYIEWACSHSDGEVISLIKRADKEDNDAV